MFGRSCRHHARADDRAGLPCLFLWSLLLSPWQNKYITWALGYALLVLARSSAATWSAHRVTVANATCELLTTMSWLACSRRASWITDDSWRHDDDFSTDQGRIRYAWSQLSERSVSSLLRPRPTGQQGRCVDFSPVDPQVGSVLCSNVQRQLGATQSRLVRRGKGADEYSLTSPLP